MGQARPSTGLLPARTTVPRAPSATVARQRLYAQLDQACRGRLTVVSAAPGFGKTSAVSGWAVHDGQSRPVAWLSLEREDNCPAAFWAGVLHALRATGAVPPDHPLVALGPAATMSAERLRATHQALLSLPTPIVLVLDDFHRIEDPAVLESLEAVLRHDLHLRLVTLSRSDLELPVHRLRLAGEVAEVGAADLSFTPDEVRELAAVLGLDLDAATVDEIHRRTDGWPAGVRLALLHLARPDSPRDLSAFGGGDRFVDQYFGAEVLDRQTPAVRDFLVRTSVASRLCAELANELAPGQNGHRILAELERTNQFVTALGADRRWYRYHPLLRETLVGRLASEDPDGYRAANGTAARWMSARGEPVPALRHALVAEDWSLFAAIFVESAWPAILGKDRQSVLDLLAAVPYDDLPATAATVACQGALALGHGRLLALPSYVERARLLLPAMPPELRPSTHGAVEVLACAAARGVSDAATMRRASQAALDLADRAESEFPSLPSVRAVAGGNLGVAMLWSGLTEPAGSVFTTAADGALARGLDLAACNSWSHLALCRFVEGDLDDAAVMATAALDRAAPRGITLTAQLRTAHLTSGLLGVLRGDADEADRSIASGFAATDGGVEPATTTMLAVCQALIAVSRRRGRAARVALDAATSAAAEWDPPPFVDDWLDRARTETVVLEAAGHLDDADPAAELARSVADVAAELGRRDTRAVTQACLARLALAAGDLPAARRWADRVLAPRGEADELTRIEARLVRALVADRLRHDHDAREHLEAALRLAQPQRLWRPLLVVDPDRLPVLIGRHLEHADAALGADAELVQRLLDAQRPGPEPEPLTEALTDRELTVLWALPTLQTNVEIAESLFVSVNTVKVHLKSLYRKLDVGNRREAVRRSRVLGLLP